MAKSLRFGGNSEVSRLVADRNVDGQTEVFCTMSVLVEAGQTNKVVRQFLEDTGSVKALAEMFWRKEGGLREMGLGAFPVKGTHHDQTLLMRIQGDERMVRFEGVEVSKISIQPHPGRVVSMRFTIGATIGPERWDWLRPALEHGAVLLEFVAPAQVDFADDLAHSEAVE